MGVKKHTLNEHLRDVKEYVKIPSYTGENVYTVLSNTEALIIAYERWLNNRELLSEEDKK